MSDRDDSSTQSLSDFSDSFPSTTTISTVAVQSGQSKIILAVMRCGTWIKVRIQRMEPDLYDIGSSGTSAEVRQLLEQHASLVSKLAAKQDQISELLTRAEEMVSQQPTEGQARVYSAISSSLNKAWRELLDVLGKRGHLLQLVAECFENAETVHGAVARIIDASASGDWGDSIESVQRLIQEHEELKRVELMEPIHRMLEAANGALDLLTRMAVRTGQTPESGLTRTSAETRERIAAVTGDANEAHRLAENAWERRAKLLQLRLTVVRLEIEHEQVVEWFSRVGEPNLAATLPRTTLQECETAMEALMGLAIDAREYQHVNSRLVRQAQQLILPRGETEEPDLEMQTAHKALVDRFVTAENYIWEFIDRIESRRRCLQASIIFFSEAAVLLDHLKILEGDISVASTSRQEVRDEILQRLTELEMRVPGLREILTDLRSRVDEKPSVIALSLTPTTPSRSVSPLTPTADAAMSAKLNEIEDIITRCRRLCSGFPGREIKDQQSKEIDYRLTALWRWTQEKIDGVLRTHQSPGTTISSVSDFEDLHKHLERQMASQQREISTLNTLILSLPPTSEKQNFQHRLDEIIEAWTHHRRTVTIRLRIADDLNRLLRRIREDEYYYQALNDRLKSVAAETPLTSSDVNLRVSQELREGEISHIHSDLLEVRSRLESQQRTLQQALDELSNVNATDADKTELQNFYRSQIQLNLERLHHLEEQLSSLLSTKQIWLSWDEKWNDFKNSARRLDEAMSSSRARIVQSSRPQSVPAVEAALAEHTRDGDYVNQLIAEVNAKANTLASLVGAEPTVTDGPSRVRRYVEVPYTTPGPIDTELAKSVKSELCIATAGLETRSKDWERVFNAHKHTLEERAKQLTRMIEMDKVERDLQDAESEFQRISITVNLDSPMAQIEQADENLRALERRIPELKSRIQSTAYLPRMQLIRGPSDLLEISGADLPMLEERQRQLETRVSNLVAGTAKCRTEVNLTLQLLRAVREAENRLSSLTVDLGRSSDHLKSLAPDDQVSMHQIIADIEKQRDRAQKYADQHVPQLQSLAAQFPGDQALIKVQPIIRRFQDSTEALNKLVEDVPVRSEQLVDVARLQGPVVEAVEVVASHQMHLPRPRPPTILRPLPNIHVAEGTRVSLMTTFDAGIPQGYPEPVDIEGTWHRDGLPVTTPDYRTSMDQHSASLTIEEVFGDDSGVFTFRLKTPFGEAETSGSLVVSETHKSISSIHEEMITPTKRRKPQQAPPSFPPFKEETGEAPRFTRPLRSTEVGENQSIMLECHATGSPVPTIAWFKDGISIDNSPEYVVFEVNGSCAIKIRKANAPVHDGNYTCRARNTHGEAITTCQLHVKPIEPPRIVYPLSDKQVPEGQSLELKLTFKGTPPIRAEWYVNDVPLESVQSSAIPNIVGDKAVLKLPATYQQDAAQYTCVLKNSAGEARSSCQVDLRPRRVERPLNIEELIDAASVPPARRPPSQSPLQDGQQSPIASSPRLPIAPSRPESLDRGKISPRSVYSPVSVEARPPWRATSVPPQLSSIYRTEHHRDLLAPKRTFSPGQLPPQFTQPLHNAAATEGQMVRLQCRVLGRPRPQIDWYKDGASLTPAPNYAIRAEGDRHWIEFSDIYLTDHGEYSCVATNPAGVAKTSCRMDVEPLSSGDESVDRTPQIVKSLPRYLTINEGEGVTLECSFVGRPEPSITWYKDSVPLQASPNVEISQVGSTAVLNMTDSNIQDAGVYKAVASNRVGVCQSEIHVNILPTGKGPRPMDALPLQEGPPRFTKPIRDIHMEPRSPRLSRFDCFVLGIPRPTVEWRHANQKIGPEDQRYHITADRPPGVHTLTILQPSQDTAGHYEVLAENIHGSATCSATVYLPRKRSLSSLTSLSPVVYATLPRQTSPWRQISPAASVHVIPTYATQTTRRFMREVSEPPELRRYTSTTQLHVNERHTTPPVHFTFRLPPEKAMSKVEVMRPIESMPSPRPQIKHASSLTVLNKMQVCPVVPLQETIVQHRVASHPRLSPGYVSTEDLMRPIEVVPMVPVYETRRVLESPQPKPLRRTVSQDRFKVSVEALIPSRPVLESNMATEVFHHKTIQVTPIVPMYRTQREASVASQPALEPGYTSEGEFEHSIDVVPMIPSYKTETERSVPARPSLETGFESKTSIERRMEIERELTELRYKTQMERPVPAQPQLVPGYATTMDVEHSMDVVPLIQKPEERFQTSYSTDVSVQYVPVDLVVELPTPPKFVQHLNNVVAEAGSQVVLEGIVSGKPTPSISWFRKSTPLTDSPDFRLEYCPDGTVRLTLKEVFTVSLSMIHEADVGPYRCEASNIAGTADSYAYLTITAKAIAPRFVKGLDNATVLGGNTIRLTVKVEGQPKPDVKWTVNGCEITSSPDFVIDETADGVQSLTILHALKTNAGRYSVVAKNEAGEAITSGTVTVLESLPPSTLPSPRPVGEEVTRTEVNVPLAMPTPGPTIAPTPEAPKFTKLLPRCRTVEEETPMVLTVEAKANPMPFLHWYRNGTPLETGPNYKVSQFGPNLENISAIQPESVRMVGELEMSRATPTDAGMIVCIAENPYGRAETTMTLDVIPKPEPLQPSVQPPTQANPQKPWFTIPLQPTITLQAGAPLTLSTEAMGNPLPFLHWYRDGHQLDSTPEHDITQVGPELAKPEALLDGPVSMTGRLIINELFPTDSGTYRCVAENSAGQAETFMTLNVLPPPVEKQGQRPRFVRRLAPTTQCKVGETVVLETEISGQPPPRVSWYRSGLEIYPDFKYRMEENPNTGIYRLVIQSIAQEDVCEYAVRACNEYGSVESITRLTLIQEYTEVTRIDLPRTLAPVTVEVPYTPTEKTQLDVQVESTFSPVVMAVEVKRPRQHLSELEMELKQPRMEFQPITVEFPHPERSGQPAVFVRRLPDSLTLDENVPARIVAQMSGIPLPSVNWLKDGQPLKSSDRVFTSVEPNNILVLQLIQPRPIDSGTYTAIVTNSLGQDTSSVQVNLSAPPEPKLEEPMLEKMGAPPNFTKAPFPLPPQTDSQKDVIQSPSVFTSMEGAPVKFEVQVYGVPEPSVSWFLNDVPVRLDYKHKMLKLPESVHCLTLEAPTSLTDSGTYRCVASNPFGVKEIVFPVTIEPKPQQVTAPPRFTKKPAPKIVALPGQPLLLEAEFMGIPAPVISWHKDGRLISPTEVSSGRVQVLVTKNTTTLSVAEVKPEDVGIWQCLASSTAGSATCRTKLDLEVPKPVVEEPQRMLFIPKKRTSVSGPSDSPYPEIRQPPKSLDVVEGNTARFSTMIVGTPRPLVRWYINGVLALPTIPLEGSTEEPRELSHFDGLLHHFELRDCRPEDSGVVTVEALRGDVSEDTAKTEPNAVVTASANLRVLPAPGKIPLLRPVQKTPVQQTKSSQPPAIIQGPKNSTVQEGSSVTFTCQIAGSPAPEVIWIYDGQTAIQPGANFHTIVTPDGKASLRIDQVRPEDTGEYKIRVTNPEGSVEKSARLDVIPAEKAPEFTTPFPKEILELPEGMSLTLDVEVVGKPTPQLVWKRDGIPFSPIPEIQITQLTPTHHRLEILELFQTDSSEFTVEAFNKLGKAVTKTKLIVLPGVKEQPPFFTTCPPERLTVPETDGTQIEFVVRGEPKPKVRYFHNDIELFPTRVGDSSTKSKDKRVEENVNDDYVFFINEVNKEDAGEYIIRAENELGISVCKTEIRVESLGPKTKVLFSKPLPQKRIITVDHKTIFECEAIAKQPIKFLWYIDEKEIDTTTRDVVVKTEGQRKSTLIMPATQKENIPKEITVKAITTDGDYAKSTTKIEYMESKRVPLRFVQPLQPTVAPSIGED
ncbi:unnamed protein product, partial [Hydatigera taeniaeformis]|uniref:Titin n=1 Tax=Hydatigena taeniaeformis TaxID=6205 RepID=A0A158RDX6_HYDTA